eukprot:14618477-Alexandrium_andersonii.AAC.1
MSASLVGSEMCIRDRPMTHPRPHGCGLASKEGEWRPVGEGNRVFQRSHSACAAFGLGQPAGAPWSSGLQRIRSSPRLRKGHVFVRLRKPQSLARPST